MKSQEPGICRFCSASRSPAARSLQRDRQPVPFHWRYTKTDLNNCLTRLTAHEQLTLAA